MKDKIIDVKTTSQIPLHTLVDNIYDAIPSGEELDVLKYIIDEFDPTSGDILSLLMHLTQKISR